MSNTVLSSLKPFVLSSVSERSSRGYERGPEVLGTAGLLPRSMRKASA
jgi:hypothetical protein